MEGEGEYHGKAVMVYYIVNHRDKVSFYKNVSTVLIPFCRGLIWTIIKGIRKPLQQECLSLSALWKTLLHIGRWRHGGTERSHQEAGRSRGKCLLLIKEDAVVGAAPGLSAVDKREGRACRCVLRNESRISKGIYRNQPATAARLRC